MPAEMEKFQRDLLAAVKQMKRGEVARTTKVQLPAAAEARAQVGLSQQDFANLLGVAHLAGLGTRPKRAKRSGKDTAASSCRSSRSFARVG
jgi:hypothetical protein